MIDLIGKRFEKLIVLARVKNAKDGHTRWMCLCDCGNKTIVTSNNLKNRRTKSCGCARLRHGHNRKGQISKTYRVWSGMLSRCNNPNRKAYKYYGGRGIKVCNRWSNKNPKGFQNFLADVGEIPEGLTLDRINNNKGYSPGNWRLTTMKEQARNKTTNINIPFEDGFLCLKDYCKIKGLNYKQVLRRIGVYRWSIKKALTTPVKKYKNE
jgi:hypothetical protein